MVLHSYLFEITNWYLKFIQLVIDSQDLKAKHVIYQHVIAKNQKDHKFDVFYRFA